MSINISATMDDDIKEIELDKPYRKDKQLLNVNNSEKKHKAMLQR